jgi:chromosome partitioning protein
MAYRYIYLSDILDIYLLAREVDGPMIVCFAAHKGGTGKTVSSVNVAACLARTGKRTLLIDMDPQAHASMALGVTISYEDPGTADLLGERPPALTKIVQPTSLPRLSVAPSSLRLASVADALFATFRREDRLAKSLARDGASYEWIVIDCPPALGVLTANALTATDVAIIPCHMGAWAVDGLQDLLDLLSLLKGERFDAWAILQTLVDSRKRVTQEIFQEMLAPYADHVLETKIFASEALNQSQMAKQDVFTFDPRSRGALNYEALCRELLARYS